MKTTFIYITVCILVFSSKISIAANLTTQSTTSGEWSNNAIWNNGTPGYIINNNSIITIKAGHTITSNNMISSSGTNTITMYIYGSLTINGNIESKNNVTITIFNGGSLIINGNIIVKNNSTITINSISEVTVNGTIEGINNNIITGSGILNSNGVTGFDMSSFNGSLPIELVSFTAKNAELGIDLQWQTASETNNEYFNIERSENGVDFTTISHISGKGTTKETNLYSYIDNSANSAIVYYRLTQYDYDGKSSSSEIISINNRYSNNFKTEVYPNPATSIISTKHIYTKAQIFSSNMTLVKTITEQNNTIEIRNLETGIYYLVYQDIDGNSYNSIFSKN